MAAIDKVSQFDLRPQELLLVTILEFYYCQFSFKKLKPSETQSALQQNLTTSCWLDARGNKVRLRRQALDKFLRFCMTKIDDKIDHQFVAAEYLNLFRNHVPFQLVDYSEDGNRELLFFLTFLPKMFQNYFIYCSCSVNTKQSSISTKVDASKKPSRKASLFLMPTTSQIIIRIPF